MIIVYHFEFNLCCVLGVNKIVKVINDINEKNHIIDTGFYCHSISN